MGGRIATKTGHYLTLIWECGAHVGRNRNTSCFTHTSSFQQLANQAVVRRLPAPNVETMKPTFLTPSKSDGVGVTLPPLKRTVVALYGLPGSGKTTLRKMLIEAHKDLVVVSNDEISAALFPDGERDTATGAKIVEVRKATLRNALNAGKSVVVDNTNLNPRALRELWQEATKAGGQLVIIDLSGVGVAECERRNALREGTHRVPDGVIQTMFDTYLKRGPVDFTKLFT